MAAGAALGVILITIGLIGTFWVFVDASQNSSQSAVLWGLVALFGGILGILLYLLLGRDGKADGTEKTRARTRPRRGTGKISHRCQSCGEKYYVPDSDIRSCRNCGGIKIERLG